MDEGRATGTGGQGGLIFWIIILHSAPPPKVRGGAEGSGAQGCPPPPTSAPSRRPCRRPRGAPPPLYFCRLRYFSLIFFKLTLRPWILVPDARKMLGFFLQFHFLRAFVEKKPCHAFPRTFGVRMGATPIPKFLDPPLNVVYIVYVLWMRASALLV